MQHFETECGITKQFLNMREISRTEDQREDINYLTTLLNDVLSAVIGDKRSIGHHYEMWSGSHRHPFMAQSYNHA
jgi:hypothetical protein